MKHDNLSIRLEPREDRSGQKYFIGKLKFPGTINLENGASFIIFTSEEGQEELQIAVNNENKDKRVVKEPQVIAARSYKEPIGE